MQFDRQRCSNRSRPLKGQRRSSPCCLDAQHGLAQPGRRFAGDRPQPRRDHKQCRCWFCRRLVPRSQLERLGRGGVDSSHIHVGACRTGVSAVADKCRIRPRDDYLLSSGNSSAFTVPKWEHLNQNHGVLCVGVALDFRSYKLNQLG